MVAADELMLRSHRSRRLRAARHILATAATEVGTYTITYDPRNALKSLAEPGGKIVTYSYDLQPLYFPLSTFSSLGGGHRLLFNGGAFFDFT